MKYEVTAKMTIEADSAAEAVELFDQEYRDSYNVVNLQAALIMADWTTGKRRLANMGTDQTSAGERRNNTTLVTQPTASWRAEATPTDWQLEQVTCHACGTGMTRLALYGHECPELKASRNQGRRILAAMQELGPDDESERFDG